MFDLPGCRPVDGTGRVPLVCASHPCEPANPDRCFRPRQDYGPAGRLVSLFLVSNDLENVKQFIERSNSDINIHGRFLRLAIPSAADSPLVRGRFPS